ncbi:tRNA (adenosine(37)-N6)-threonylcarbamoyltransferase complex ATPase subunit type 1 TsaE [Luteimonas sp. 3794]|uniref:tRNA (adenosine(37)-N6)-threonylcarbamoyltransferase complex ATPase subunit type 1 TsaE n=1 Tax=Luteimonas sp. 3794 TaxID=2817730 RepID=UPI002855B2EE|nr:tRNA (adenosine(37)-N6)-threonylcarbamoyltransferase complex ATPase subunit type 1 TsaE [Luteimonas sp. 3794]MDR6992326.1 tRNA threonylcarbamoyladenosine biosynthesis protein TsaE [Luteimonas sp. 3794]
MIRRHLPDEAATQGLAEVLATHQPRGAVVHLQGDLGAGKSTLARAWLRALGVTGTVRSPTYTLVERYPVDGGEALHLDLYRIGDAGELDFLGLDDIDAALWLVEWPERGAAALPPADLEIRLAIDGAGRAVELWPYGAAGTRWLAQLIDDPRLSTLPEPKP